MSNIPPGYKIDYKSWGHEEWLVNFNKYCAKLLFLKKNHFCSFHCHRLKTESFIVLDGKVQLIYCLNPRVSDSEIDFTDYGNDTSSLEFPQSIILHPKDRFHIEPGLWHRFIGLEDSLILEVSTQHFDEDSYRALPSGKLDEKTTG